MNTEGMIRVTYGGTGNLRHILSENYFSVEGVDALAPDVREWIAANLGRFFVDYERFMVNNQPYGTYAFYFENERDATLFKLWYFG